MLIVARLPCPVEFQDQLSTHVAFFAVLMRLQEPLVRVMFSYVSRLKQIAFHGLQTDRLATDRGMSDFDLFLTLYQDKETWQGLLEYNTDLFAAETVRKVIRSYRKVLELALDTPTQKLSSLALEVPANRPLKISLAATFTVDPIEQVFRFLAKELRVRFKVGIAPYNQLFQQLLAPQARSSPRTPPST